MKLKNRFDNADKIRYWVDHQYCAVCKSNQNCSIHHIDGTVSASMYNSIMLCYIHHKEADAHNTNSPLSVEFRNNLREYTYKHLERLGKLQNDKDAEYLNKYRTS